MALDVEDLSFFDITEEDEDEGLPDPELDVYEDLDNPADDPALLELFGVQVFPVPLPGSMNSSTAEFHGSSPTLWKLETEPVKQNSDGSFLNETSVSLVMGPQQDAHPPSFAFDVQGVSYQRLGSRQAQGLRISLEENAGISETYIALDSFFLANMAAPEE